MTMTTTTTMTTIIETTTTRTLKNFTSCTSLWSSEQCQQWTSCLLKSFFELWIMHVFNTTFGKSRRSCRTRSSTNQFQSAILRNRLTSWNKKRFAWFAESTTNERIFIFRRFLSFKMFFKFDQFWSVKRDSLSHVVQIESVHDRKSRLYNKKARQQRVLLWVVKTCELQFHHHIYRSQFRRNVRRIVR
jgi:hypothetical protein